MCCWNIQQLLSLKLTVGLIICIELSVCKVLISSVFSRHYHNMYKKHSRPKRCVVVVVHFGLWLSISVIGLQWNYSLSKSGHFRSVLEYFKWMICYLYAPVTCYSRTSLLLPDSTHISSVIVKVISFENTFTLKCSLFSVFRCPFLIIKNDIKRFFWLFVNWMKELTLFLCIYPFLYDKSVGDEKHLSERVEAIYDLANVINLLNIWI